MSEQPTEIRGKGDELLPAMESSHFRQDLICIREMLKFGYYSDEQIGELFDGLLTLFTACVKAKNTRGARRIYQCLLETGKLEVAANKALRPTPAKAPVNVGAVFITAEQHRLSEISAQLGVDIVCSPAEETRPGGGKLCDDGGIPPGRNGDGNGKPIE